MNRVTSIVVTDANAAVPDERHYGYDAVGNRTWSIHGELTPSNGNPIGEVYQYDAIDQITGVKYGAENPNLGYVTASSPAKTETFTYDAAGNRTSTSIDAATTTYTVNDLNQYTALGGAITETPIWNTRGDLATYRDWTYKYDTFGNLRKTTNSTTTVKYHYDASGTRVARTKDTDTVLYLNLGNDLIEEYTPDNLSAVSYIYESGIDRPIARINESTGEILFYHQDVLGNIIALTDNNGVIAESYSYDVFGKVTVRDHTGTVKPTT